MESHLINAMTDLELLQSFSSPSQIAFLASRNVFDSQETMQRLAILHKQYSETPSLLSHVRYPRALYFLHITLTSSRFRIQLKNPGYIAYLERYTTINFSI